MEAKENREMHEAKIAATHESGHWICDCGRKVRSTGSKLVHTTKVLDAERAARFAR
jgi:hypothetical protein